MAEGRQLQGIGGWLLLLCVLLLVWQPISLALVASSVVDSIAIRGLPMAVVLTGRLLVAALAIAAGLALVGRRPAAVPMATTSLVASAAMDAFVYLTPFFPTNQVPGDEIVAVGASVLYSALWIAYLARSRRVHNTYR
jgi:hypothetical protein